MSKHNQLNSTQSSAQSQAQPEETFNGLVEVANKQSNVGLTAASVKEPAPATAFDVDSQSSVCTALERPFIPFTSSSAANSTGQTTLGVRALRDKFERQIAAATPTTTPKSAGKSSAQASSYARQSPLMSASSATGKRPFAAFAAPSKPAAGVTISVGFGSASTERAVEESVLSSEEHRKTMVELRSKWEKASMTVELLHPNGGESASATGRTFTWKFSESKSNLSMQDCPINKLTNADLSAIFEYLLPYERLLAAKVCRRWHDISRKAWLDITSIDLCPIPGKYINAIIHQCPKLQSVFALQKSFGPEELHCLPEAANLSCVKFYDCDFATATLSNANKNSDFAWVFSEQLKHMSWSELTIHNSDPVIWRARLSNFRLPKWAFAENLPASLTRLQLSGLITGDALWKQPYEELFETLELPPNLECLVLLTTQNNHVWYTHGKVILKKIACLKNLRELALFPGYRLDIAAFVASLPKLEVLFLYGIVNSSLETLGELITKASVLRTLLLSAESPPRSDGLWYDPFESGHVELPLVFPARKRFPHGFGSDPLPLLHIFIGNHMSSHLRFTKSSLDAAIVHAIDNPLPEFLEREDIAPIFKGVWVAEKIKETAKLDPTFWLSKDGDTNNSIQWIQ